MRLGEHGWSPVWSVAFMKETDISKYSRPWLYALIWSSLYHFNNSIIALDLMIAFCLNCPCIKWDKCQKTSFCISFVLFYYFLFKYFSSWFFMFFILFFLFFFLFWNQEKEKGEISRMMNYRRISCFVANCLQLWTCLMLAWIMIIMLRARVSSKVSFTKHP